MLTGSNPSPDISCVAEGSAIPAGLRVKWGTAARGVVLAGDEACIGVSVTSALAVGDRLVVRDIKSPGSLPFTAGGAIAAAAAFTSAAAGKVVTGTGGAEDYGRALEAAQGDGSQFAGTSAK